MITGFYILSILMALLAYFVPGSRIKNGLSFIHALLIAALAYLLKDSMGQSVNVFFEADTIGLIMLSITALVGLLSSIHYEIYARLRKESKRSVAIHNSISILFLSALSGVVLTNHFGMLWAFMEATTLTGAVLLYHDREKLALEAVWKYVFVASISVALAFVGILFLSLAPKDGLAMDFSFAFVTREAQGMNPMWIQACFLFILTGFSIKMGIVPMFNVDIDAKDVSPSPVGALFSSVLLNGGFLSIFRFYTAFSQTEILPWMNHVLIICGVLSVLFATIYLLKVKNYKRIFAYSSMEHGGLVLLGLSMGKAGAIAAILHLILHSLVKSSLFFQFGDIFRQFHSKLEDQAGGYFYKNTFGASVVLLGLISILALPPSGLFVSEFMIFHSFVDSGHLFLAIGIMLLLLVILYFMGQSVGKLLFIPKEQMSNHSESYTSAWYSLPLIAMIGFSMYLGISRPPMLMNWIEVAVQMIP